MAPWRRVYCTTTHILKLIIESNKSSDPWSLFSSERSDLVSNGGLGSVILITNQKLWKVWKIAAHFISLNSSYTGPLAGWQVLGSKFMHTYSMWMRLTSKLNAPPNPSFNFKILDTRVQEKHRINIPAFWLTHMENLVTFADLTGKYIFFSQVPTLRIIYSSTGWKIRCFKFIYKEFQSYGVVLGIPWHPCT